MSQFNFYVWGILSAASSVLCFASALGLLSLVSSNKGARINLTWILLAFALICFGAAEGGRVLLSLSLADIVPWEPVLRALGALLALIGVLYGRRLFKELLK